MVKLFSFNPSLTKLMLYFQTAQVLLLILQYCGARGSQRVPDTSGLQASVTKLSRWWPFCIIIHVVTQWRNCF